MALQIPEYKNLVDMLQFWAERSPDKVVYTFLNDGDEDETHWTYSELDRQARRIAAQLQAAGLAGERAVLIYAPGMEYIAGFFGCLYAGVVAVPAYPPDPTRLERTLPRLQKIIEDSRSKAILTTEIIFSMAQVMVAHAPDLEKLQWIVTDRTDSDAADQWEDPQLDANHLAFLQYTSGSTGDPKGVMLSHGNLLTNMRLIAESFGLERERDTGGSWLPPYHDMGLIGGIMESLFIGTYSVLMSPLHFLQRPMRWLKAVSKYKIWVSGGPNFAYELAARKAKPEEIAQLDLSPWKVAFCGAEPILPQTVERFCETFAPAGFDPQAFYPCYGLAEGTLIVSGSRRGQGISSKRIQKEDFKKNTISSADGNGHSDYLHLVGCGNTLSGQEILIARPDTLHPCEEGEVGEILVKGPSVAQGYWEKPELSQEIFKVEIPATGNGPFLRTGDLGFLDGEQLYVTGRLKDLIIIRGANHYPQDIERTVENSHPAMRAGGTAAFSVQMGVEEKLVVVSEADLDKAGISEQDYPALEREIRKAVAAEHDLDPYAIVLIKKGSLPKTSSGKVRRSATSQEYLAGSLPVLHTFQAPTPQEIPGESMISKPPQPGDSQGMMDIQSWLIDRLSDHLEVDPNAINASQPLSEFGLDSKDAVNLSGDLEDWLGRKLSPTLLWKYPTIEKLAEYLAGDGTAA
jgi:acyl-CoA synthetase (AMP-forming)/AMP-acid ligase II/acyl carrier protein